MKEETYYDKSIIIVFCIPSFVENMFLRSVNLIYFLDCPQPLKVLNECLKVYKNEAFSENNTMNWQVGNCCLCFYEAEKIWARAKVIGIKDKLLEVKSVCFTPNNHLHLFFKNLFNLIMSELQK